MANKFDKSKFLIGAYFFNKEIYDDVHMKELADCGVDFLVAVDNDPALAELCKKYGIGIIAHNNIPGWWGGNGDNAGQYGKNLPLEKFDEIQKNYKPDDIIWGDYIVDEPNSKDFKHINEVCKKYREIYPGKLDFVNLYPNYASVPTNNDEETISQLGNKTYEEHIAQYVRDIDLNYICYDFYPYTGRPYDTYLENFDITAKACRRSNRDLWLIIQSGAWKKEDILDEYQILWQVNLCLAYGTSVIMHASYCKGWWDETTSCVDLKGEKNVTYYYVQRINKYLHEFGPQLLNYRNTAVYVNGDISKSHIKIRPQLLKQNNDIGEDIIDTDIVINADGAVLTGYFIGNTNNKKAVLLVNTNDPFNKDDVVNVNVSFKNNTVPVLYINGNQSQYTNSMTIKSGESVFIVY